MYRYLKNILRQNSFIQELHMASNTEQSEAAASNKTIQAEVENFKWDLILNKIHQV